MHFAYKSMLLQRAFASCHSWHKHDPKPDGNMDAWKRSQKGEFEFTVWKDENIELSCLRDALRTADTRFPFRHWFQTLKA